MHYSTISALQHDLKTGKTSCVEVVQHYIDQIEQHKELNAFLEVFSEEAIQKATETDQKKKEGKSLGRLFGVVIGIKDNICYQGHKVTAASKILGGFESLYSSTVVSRLLEEDAIIIGRLNCDEFAMGSSNENSAYGNVLNAADHSRSPGGSSGGSAVAVQANLCQIALGSDTGGSIRQPASFCGVVGLKPTYGRVSRYGLIAFASSFDQIGPFAKSVEDAALVLEIIAGSDQHDSTTSQKPVPQYDTLSQTKSSYRIAYLKDAFQADGLDEDVRSATNDCISQLKKMGHEVQPVSFPLLDYVIPAYYILTTAEASSNLSRYDGVHFGHRSSKATNMQEVYELSRTEGFGKEVKNRIMLGTFVLSAGYYDAYYSKAQKVRRMLLNAVREIYKEYDFILSPTAPTTAFKLGEKINDPVTMYLADIYTVLANLVGAPAISLPLYTSTTDLPIGIQFMANQFEEEELLRFSNQLVKEYDKTIT